MLYFALSLHRNLLVRLFIVHFLHLLLHRPLLSIPSIPALRFRPYFHYFKFYKRAGLILTAEDLKSNGPPPAPQFAERPLRKHFSCESLSSQPQPPGDDEQNGY